MSKTSLEVVNILYQRVKNGILFSDAKKPNGGLYKFQRPANSVKEDVIINSLPIDRSAVQQGVLNVNTFVPNLVIGSDNSQPNTARLTELAVLFNQALGEGNEVSDIVGDYIFNIQQDNIFSDTNNQHYINFRIEFYSPN